MPSSSEIENYRTYLEYMNELNERLKIKNLDLILKKMKIYYLN